MTHPLSTELREIADNVFQSSEGGYLISRHKLSASLRAAATALDAAEWTLADTEEGAKILAQERDELGRRLERAEAEAKANMDGWKEAVEICRRALESRDRFEVRCVELNDKCGDALAEVDRLHKALTGSK